MLCTVVTQVCCSVSHTSFSWTGSAECHVWLQTVQRPPFPEGVTNSGRGTRTTSSALPPGGPELCSHPWCFLSLLSQPHRRVLCQVLACQWNEGLKCVAAAPLCWMRGPGVIADPLAPS